MAFHVCTGLSRVRCVVAGMIILLAAGVVAYPALGMDPPTVQIDNGPAEGSTITFNNPAFSWSGMDDGSIVLYLLSLEGPTPLATETTATFLQLSPRENGDYTFCVVARDDEGQESAPACRSFTIDAPTVNQLPTAQIDNGPAEGSTITFNNPAFTWSGTDTDGTVVQFAVDLTGPSSINLDTENTFYQFDGLSNGNYTLCVRAEDNRGGVSNAACRAFIVDVVVVNQPPSVTITNGPAENSIIEYDNPAFAWSGTDADGGIVSYQVDLSGPIPSSFSTTTTFFQFTALTSGAYTLCVQAEDNGGAQSAVACRSFSVDLPIANMAPTALIENGPAENAEITYDNPAFSWRGIDADGTVVSFSVELRSPIQPLDAFTTTDTFYQLSGLNDGSYAFCVRATDDEGAFSEWACRPFSIVLSAENLPPTVAINNGPAPDTTLTFSNPAFSWSALDADGVVDSFFVELQGPTPLSIATATGFYQFNGLADGGYTFCVQARDDDEALSVAACRAFTIALDNPNVAPTVVVENGPGDNSVITFNNPAFSWQGSDTDGVVVRYDIELIGPTPLTVTTEDAFYQFPALATGAYSFCVRALDDDDAFSSWACRAFTINGAIAGTLKDLYIDASGNPAPGPYRRCNG